MIQKRVLIVSRHPLFDAAIQAALGQQSDIEVIGVCRDDLEAAHTQAQMLRPDVVLLVAGREAIRQSALRLVEDVSGCLIRVDISDKSMQVYRREQVDQAGLKDLIAVIQIANVALADHEQQSLCDTRRPDLQESSEESEERDCEHES